MSVRRVTLTAAAAVLVVSGCSSAGTPTTDPTTSSAPSSTSTPSPANTTAGTTAPASTTSSSPARAAASVPPVSAAARRAGLRDVRTVVPDAIVDLRYATTNNFTHQRLYPTRARCLIHSAMAPGLERAGDRARAAGLQLVFWDCYRPHYVQVRMYRVVPNPAWVAKPGPYARSHEAGRSVDVTLAWRSTRGACPSHVRIQGHCVLRMGTAFDAFTPRAYAFATAGVPAIARSNRAKLRRVLGAGGLVVYSGEWWHFDGPGSTVNRPYLRAPVY